MRTPSPLLLAVLSLAVMSHAHAASLEKARALQTNGLLVEAKRELVELSFDPDATANDKAEALVLLGDIGIDENRPDVAKENWSKVQTIYADQPAASLAREKLALLEKLATRAAGEGGGAAAQPYADGTILVVGPSQFAWAAPQISGALGASAMPFSGGMVDALSLARTHPEIKAVVEVALNVDTAFENGRVVCQLPSGSKVWEEKVMFNLGGGQERIARRFVDSLVEKVKKRRCPQ